MSWSAPCIRSTRSPWSGRNYLLVQGPTIAHGVDDWSRPAVLNLRTGQLTDINAPAFYGPFDIAW